MNATLNSKKEQVRDNNVVQKKQSPFFNPIPIQKKLNIGASNDMYEIEADQMANQVVNMSNSQVQKKIQTGPLVQRKCATCEQEEKLQKKSLAENITPLIQKSTINSGGESTTTDAVTSEINRSMEGGDSMRNDTRNFMESRFGSNFSTVKIHTDSNAIQLSRQLNAQAFTVGNDIYFNEGKYNPNSKEGKQLLAHELTHTIQQGGIKRKIQRTLSDGHDLTSPRFSRLLDLEAAYDDEDLIQYGDTGRGVQAVQMALYDLGFSLPNYGSDGKFKRETTSAVKAFQSANPPLSVDGKVGPNTMSVLDTRFGAPVLPSATVLASPWTAACVRQVLCPWSPHTIDVLRSRITLKSFDSISWADEEWNGANWVPAKFIGGGYNSGTEIGVLNSTCESISETLYHEVLHAEQPSTHRTTRDRESYAYRIGEEFSIAMGLTGRSSLRSTDGQGREYANRTSVDTYVSTNYPSVSSSGAQDEIIEKASTNGHVIVERPNGSRYTRAAVIGEKVPGPISLANEVVHPTNTWTCP